jgi:hypothetical protein
VDATAGVVVSATRCTDGLVGTVSDGVEATRATSTGDCCTEVGSGVSGGELSTVLCTDDATDVLDAGIETVLSDCAGVSTKIDVSTARCIDDASGVTDGGADATGSA